jgi:hypothetical protein
MAGAFAPPPARFVRMLAAFAARCFDPVGFDP